MVECNGKVYKAVDYCEIIHPSTAKTLASYTSDFYSGMSAATVNSYGKGKAYYIAFRDNGDFTDLIIDELLRESGVCSDFDGQLPNGVTAHSRTDGENLFVFLENYNSVSVKTITQRQWITIETNQVICGEIELAPYETIILVRKSRCERS